MKSIRKIKLPFPEANCLTCINSIPIGKGEHVCTECGTPVIVISDYAPSDDYLKCGGSKFEA